MSWIDIAVLALVVLFGLVGVLRGVHKSLLSLGAFIIAFVVAFFLSGVIAEALIGIDSVRLFILGNGNFEEGFSLASWIFHGFGDTNAGISEGSFLFKNFLGPIDEIVGATTVMLPEFTELHGRAMYIAFIMFAALCGIGIFLVLRFLLMIVTAIIKSFIGKKKSIASRLTGFLVMAIQGGIVAFAVMLVFTCFGGLVYAEGIRVVEAEFEQTNAVFSNYMYEGAYFLRNKLYLPDTEAYGRMVNLVYQSEPDVDPNMEHLTGDRLNLYIGVQNLKYENDPWTIDVNTKKRKFVADGAVAINPDEFKNIGFDKVMKELLAYYDRLAEEIDNLDKLTDVTDTQFASYVSIITDHNLSVQKTTTDLIYRLRGYQATYLASTNFNDQEVINALISDYNHVLDELNNLKARCAELEADFEETFPDLTNVIPERVTGPYQEPEEPEEPGEGEEGEEEGGETPPAGPGEGEEEGGETPPAGGDEGGEGEGDTSTGGDVSGGDEQGEGGEEPGGDDNGDDNQGEAGPELGEENEQPEE